MNISNVTDFYYLIKRTNLHSLNHNLTPFIQCVDDYNKICSCKSNEKSNKYRDCHHLYKQLVNNEIAPFKHELFKHTNDDSIMFYDNSTVILTLIK